MPIDTCHREVDRHSPSAQCSARRDSPLLFSAVRSTYAPTGPPLLKVFFFGGGVVEQSSNALRRQSASDPLFTLFFTPNPSCCSHGLRPPFPS